MDKQGSFSSALVPLLRIYMDLADTRHAWLLIYALGIILKPTMIHTPKRVGLLV